MLCVCVVYVSEYVCVCGVCVCVCVMPLRAVSAPIQQARFCMLCGSVHDILCSNDSLCGVVCDSWLTVFVRRSKPWKCEESAAVCVLRATLQLLGRVVSLLLQRVSVSAVSGADLSSDK
jgi:hypothetical protein